MDHQKTGCSRPTAKGEQLTTNKLALVRDAGSNCGHPKCKRPPRPMNVNVALRGKWDLPDVRKDVKENPSWL